MSNFDYHTGYLPVVMDGKEHRRLITRRILLGIALVGAGYLWLNQPSESTVYQPQDTSYQETIIQESSAKVEEPIQVIKLSLNTVVVNEKVNKEGKTSMTKLVVDKKTPSFSSFDAADLESSYEKDIENILKQAFPK